MEKQTAQQKLSQVHQEHILKYWDSLNDFQRQLLLKQIELIDVNLFKIQQDLLKVDECVPQSFDPFLKYKKENQNQSDVLGKELIAAGKVGCILVAGGQGTRLQFAGPKGMYPISLIKKKSLFQIFAEKVLAAGAQVKRDLPFAIMTSPSNEQETQDFFHSHQNFGLKQNQISFFSQKMLPFLDVKGNLFLDSPFHIAEGPDGNGRALKVFFESGLWENWYRKGVRYLFYILVDNPLTDPFDAKFLTHHVETNAEITLKIIERTNEREKLGLLVNDKGNIRIKEYSEMFPEEQTARMADGSLKHKAANISVFCFNMDFVHRAAHVKDVDLQLHKAFKSAKYLENDGMAWKFEYFIFDILSISNHIETFLCPRGKCFSPLKNKEGENSIKQVQASLHQRDKETYSQMSGLKPPENPFELSPQFYYPTPEILTKWHLKPLPKEPYIEP